MCIRNYKRIQMRGDSDSFYNYGNYIYKVIIIPFDCLGGAAGSEWVTL